VAGGEVEIEINTEATESTKFAEAGMGILLLKGRGLLVAPCLRLNKSRQHIYPTSDF